MTDAGPPGASTNGFNENLSLFQQGKCGMWIDATVAASFVTNPNDSTVADKVGFALAPDTGLAAQADAVDLVVAVGDGTGRFADNWELSQARALSVVRYMIDDLGMDPERLSANGFGEYQPVNTANTEEARAQNRRIELKITEK